MEQHPVPQNISSYQFHLVGDMTLKQFLELAGGVVVGVLFYATSLPGIIKWPLILLSAGIGAALAFVPLEERPLEQWIFAFFRSVYSPTLFRWEKKEGVKYFSDEQQSAAGVEGLPTPKTSSALANLPFLSKLEAGEDSYFKRLAGFFGGGESGRSQAATVSSGTSVITGAEDVAGRGVTTVGIGTGEARFVGNPPPTETPVPIPVITNTKKEVQIPQTGFISIGKSARPQIVVEEKPVDKVNLQTTYVPTTLNAQRIADATKAKFSIDAAPPSVPTVPNTVSGQVMDAQKRIIEGAILEILDASNRPVRALKTNKAGHFLVVTPLMNGKYKIVADKEGYQFDPVEFEANGEIVQPIAISAKPVGGQSV